MRNRAKSKRWSKFGNCLSTFSEFAPAGLVNGETGGDLLLAARNSLFSRSRNGNA